MPRSRSLFRTSVALLLGVGVAMSTGACRDGAGAPDDEVTRVIVSIQPLAWIASELAPGGSDVRVLVPPGMSPHDYALTPGDARAIGQADVILHVGFGLSPALERAIEARARRDAQVVSFENGVSRDRLITGDAHDHHDHDHGHDHAHDHGHGAIDPHAWLDPALMGELARSLAGALERAGAGPVDASALAGVQRECAALKQEYQSGLSGLAGREIVTQHNAFAYLVRDTGVRVAGVLRAFESVEPTPGEVSRVIDTVRERGVRTIFVEPQFPADAAQRVAEVTGCRVLTLDPLGTVPYPQMMRANLAALEDGLGPG